VKKYRKNWLSIYSSNGVSLTKIECLKLVVEKNTMYLKINNQVIKIKACSLNKIKNKEEYNLCIYKKKRK
jgi:hypothetical protein